MATGTARATATPADLTAAYLERLRRRVRWQAEAAAAGRYSLSASAAIPPSARNGASGIVAPRPRLASSTSP